MAKTFFFYDLETSGLDPRRDRIMQFAGIRTDEQFQPIGEPYNLLVALGDDTLPSPDALMVTGITPQQTVADGHTEAEFAKIFVEEICTPDTVIVGYNNIRFDDEFMRALLWRNFYDPYQWGYKDGRTRWDMLDVVRMTRALRPEGIKWPVVDGKAVNKLELLSRENGLDHAKAHDALSDVEALIGVTKLLASAQPQLFNYLFKLRQKQAVMELVDTATPKPFVYTSGRYDAQYEKTTVAYPLAPAEHGNVYVYDLRHDPNMWVEKSDAELQQIINTPYKERDENYQKLPIKKLQYNRAPAVAPIGVLEQQDGWKKIGLDVETVQQHVAALQQHPQFATRVAKLLDGKTFQSSSFDAEARIYDGFVSNRDALTSEAIRVAETSEIIKLKPQFQDERLDQIFPRYVVRNFPRQASSEQRAAYEEYRAQRLKSSAPKFLARLEQLATRTTDTSQQFVLEELQLWFESVFPSSE